MRIHHASNNNKVKTIKANALNKPPKKMNSLMETYRYFVDTFCLNIDRFGMVAIEIELCVGTWARWAATTRW